LYPEFPANEPTVSADEWLKGAKIVPKMMRLNQGDKPKSHIAKVNFKQSVSQA
jgi:hypothetical protein